MPLMIRQIGGGGVLRQAVEDGDTEWVAKITEHRTEPPEPVTLKRAFQYEMEAAILRHYDLTPEDEVRIFRHLMKEKPGRVFELLDVDDGILSVERMKQENETFYVRALHQAFEYGNIKTIEAVLNSYDLDAIPLLPVVLDEPKPGRPKGVSLSRAQKERYSVRLVQCVLKRAGSFRPEQKQEALSVFFDRFAITYGRTLESLYDHDITLDCLGNRDEGVGENGRDWLSNLYNSKTDERDAEYAAEVLIAHGSLRNDERRELMVGLAENGHSRALLRIIEDYGGFDSDAIRSAIVAATSAGDCEAQKGLLQSFDDPVGTEAFVFSVTKKTPGGYDASGGFGHHVSRDCEHHDFVLLEQLFEAGYHPDNPDELYEALNDEFDDTGGRYKTAVEIVSRYRCFPSLDHLKQLETDNEDRAELIKKQLPGRSTKFADLRTEE